MGTKSARNFTSDIIAAEDTKTGEPSSCSAAPAKRLSLELGKEMPSLFGENSLMAADNKESTVPSSAMRVPISHLSLSDRLMQSLTFAGLVRGIIPMSMRVKSNQATLDIVLNSPVGQREEEPKGD